MKLIVCLDDNGGMAFHLRRQTRDVMQRKHMNALLKGQNLFLSDYSAKLFLQDLPDVNCIITKDPEKAEKDDCVFVEREEVTTLLRKADTVMIYFWNRTYPDDVVFPLSELVHYKKVKSEEFKGSSHDSIRFEVYEK